jgi:WD40 repeat protein
MTRGALQWVGTVALILLLVPSAPAQAPGVLKQRAAPAFRHAGPVRDLVVIDAGKRLVTASGEGALLWDMGTGRRLKTLATGHVRRLALSPQGDLLAVGGFLGTIAVHDLTTGRQRFSITPGEYVAALAFSPDGAMLASAANESEIHLWQTTSGAYIDTLSGHRGYVLDIQFHPDGKSLFSISEDGTLRQWQLATGKEMRRLTEKADWYPTALALSADGKTLALTVCTGTGSQAEDWLTHVRLLDVGTLQERFRVVLPASCAYGVQLSADGRYVAANFHWARIQDGQVRLWDSWTGKQTALDPGNNHWVNCVRFLPGGKALASAGYDRVVRLWSVADGTQHALSRGSAGPVRVVGVAPSGSVLAAGTTDGTVQLWDAVRGTPLHALRKHQPPLDAVVFSPDGKLALSTARVEPGQAALPAHLWEVRSGACRHTLLPILGRPAFSPDGKTLAAADDQNGVRLWDVATGTELRRLTGHGKRVQMVAFTPDGRQLASAGNDGTVCVWDVAAGTCLKTLPLEGFATCLWFSPDGALLFVADDYRSGSGFAATIHVFETITGQRLLDLDTGRQAPQGFWLAQSGRVLAAASAPDSWCTFDLATGKALHKDPRRVGDCNAVEFAQDGHMLAAGYEDGRLVLWQPPVMPPCPPLPAPVDEVKLRDLWLALASRDAILAYQARWLLSATPKQTLVLLRNELRLAPPDATGHIDMWIAKLDSHSYKEREQAMLKLGQAGELAIPALRKALEQKPSLEVRRRIELLLPKLVGLQPARMLRTLRAIVVLEAIGGEEARAILRELADGAPGASTTEAARAALQRL